MFMLFGSHADILLRIRVLFLVRVSVDVSELACLSVFIGVYASLWCGMLRH